MTKSKLKEVIRLIRLPYSKNASANNKIINLSTKSFTFYDFKLLNKNLNFCPTPNRYNKKQFKNDIDTFIRKVKLKAHFKNKEKGIKNREFRISRNKT